MHARARLQGKRDARGAPKIKTGVLVNRTATSRATRLGNYISPHVVVRRYQEQFSSCKSFYL